ncbi:MAG TPA: hypothetical protein VM032_06980 [Vicinamibacterales bacterium]|nr:hypothetical protein [Vicinamibacterales bacterium]
MVPRRTGLVLLLTLMSVPVVRAQRGAAPPGATAPRLDTPQARVIVATLQPRTPVVAANGHTTNRVFVYLDNGSMTHTEGGRTTTVDFHRGDVRWRAASGPYTSENTSDHPVRILEVDLKGPPAGPAVKSALDAVAVDPKHFKVLLENDAVRVIRVHYDPHDRSQNHEHVLNRVVLYLNDSVVGKMDEVRASPPRIHIEENDSDQPADAIAVELK